MMRRPGFEPRSTGFFNISYNPIMETSDTNHCTTSAYSSAVSQCQKTMRPLRLKSRILQRRSFHQKLPVFECRQECESRAFLRFGCRKFLEFLEFPEQRIAQSTSNSLCSKCSTYFSAWFVKHFDIKKLCMMMYTKK